MAPVASNLINKPGANPFFQSPGKSADWYQLDGSEPVSDAYLTSVTTITLREMVEPTRALFSMILVVFIIDVVVLKKRRVRPLDTTETWMILFSLLLFGNVLLQSNRLAFSLHTVVDAFVIPFLAYFFARRLVTSEDRFLKLTRIMGYMGVYVIVIGLIERLAHGELLYRLHGPFYDRDAFYITMGVIFFTVLLDSTLSSSLPERKHAFPRGIRWFVISLAPVIIALSLTRGAWLGFSVGLCVFLFLGRQLVNTSRTLMLVGSVLIVIPALVIGHQYILSEELVGSRIADSGNVYGRYATWMATLEEAGKQPIFGIGLNNLRNSLDQIRVDFNEAGSYSTVHNSFLSLLVEVGTVGLLAYLAIIRSIIRMGLSLYRTGQHTQVRWRGAAIISIVIAYQLPALFANTLYLHSLLMHVYVYVVVGGIAGLYGRRQEIPFPYRQAKHYRRNSVNMWKQC